MDWYGHWGEWVSDGLQTALVSGVVAIVVALIGQYSQRTSKRAAKHDQAHTPAATVPGWVFPTIIGGSLTVIGAQIVVPLIYPDRHVGFPPLLYVLAAGAVIYYVAQAIGRRD